MPDIFNQVSYGFIHKNLNGEESALVKVMDWRRVGNKPFPVG